MNCDQIRDLLPWLLNGTLEGREKAEVEAHIESCPACRAEREEVRLSGRIFATHVPAVDLVAYAFAEPTEVGRETIARHLALCPRCADELELLAESRRLCEQEETATDGAEVVAFRRPAPATAAPPVRAWRWAALAAGLTALAAAGGWMWSWQQVQTLSGRLAAARDSAETTAARLNEIAAQAGELTTATAAAQEQIARLESELESARGAGSGGAASAAPGLLLNTPIIDLFPGDVVVRGPGSPPPAATSLPGDAALVTLILNLGRRDEYPTYELRILDAAGGETLRRSGLQRDPATGSFTVSLPTSLLGRGAATIEIYGRRGAETTKIASYPVRVGG